MAKNVIGRLLESLLAAGPQKHVQQNVVRLEGGIGFQFAAPVAVFVLLREKIFTSGIDADGNAAG
jgi:hypothetical protein